MPGVGGLPHGEIPPLACDRPLIGPVIQVGSLSAADAVSVSVARRPSYSELQSLVAVAVSVAVPADMSGTRGARLGRLR